MPSRAHMRLALLAVVSLLYPVVVYSFRATLPPLLFVALALLLVGLRLATLSREAAALWRAPLIGTAIFLGLVATLDGLLAAKLYPVALSLGAALAFGQSLRRPPSLVERIARIRQPDLPPQGQLYCRKVTIVWTVWLTANAAIAALLATSDSDAAWALWTGMISYLVMGVLFGGEMLVRRCVRQRSVQA